MKEKIILIAILIIAFYFRFNNLNWDDNHHLHPDERFLTMVGTSLKLPDSFLEYVDPKISRLNPANVGNNFFVYGVFPLTLNKYFVNYLNKDNYDDFTILGRKLSAFLDLLVVILVYKIARLIIDKKKSTIPLWSSFFYAVAVLPIQLAHFFTVDTFLNFFMLASFYFSLRFYKAKSCKMQGVSLALSAIFLGLAIASKVTALYVFPLNVFFILFFSIKKRSIIKLFPLTSIYILIAYVSLRLANPYMFENMDFFNLSLSINFVNSLKELKNLVLISPDNYYPPNIQWMNKNTVIHSLVNNSVLGLGLPISIFILTGTTSVLFKNKSINHYIIVIIILFWVLLFFAYQSLQANPTNRYFIILYPFLAIIAGIGMSVINDQLSGFNKKIKLNTNLLLITEYSLLTTVLLVWPIMFTSIYHNKHSRVEASEWIYKNFKNGSVIANEHWDDGLPLPVNNNYGKQFTTLELPIFGPDNEEKWTQMNEVMAQADYYILSSNRGWGSISTVPQMYPRMSKFYEDIFAGRTKFKKIAEFTSYPALNFRISNFEFRISFPDDWADESFTVYDHPKVMIYKKN